MADLNVDSLKRKFQALNSTQDSIQTLSLWIIHHKIHYRQIMELWMEHLKEANNAMRLTLFYLANDIIQNSKRKGATVFLDSFAEVLEEAATFSRDDAIREKVLRIFKIWGERSIYLVEFCDKLQKATVSQKPTKPKPRPDTKLLVDFNHEDVPEVIEQLARFEGEVELKYRQLGMLNSDVASTETIMQLKDRAGGKRFSQQFEDSAIKLEDYVTSLTKEVELRRKLFDLLQKSEIFYEAQFGEAKIVANAYKNFGMRVASLKKRLEEHRVLLPDSFSPIPSPTMDAPSPGATPPRDPNSDSIEVEDMELSDEEEDRKACTIIAAASSGATRRTSRIAALRNKITTTTSSTAGISHISTITGAGSRSTFNQPLPSYSPFSTESPPTDYSPSDDYLPVPTSTHNSTSKKTGGDENYGQIKDRLLQVMHEPPKLPSSVKLFDSPARMGTKRSSNLPPVTIPSYTPSRKAFDQQVSPIITVPPAVPAPVSPQSTTNKYDPFKNEFTASAPRFYTPINNLAPQTRPPLQQQQQPPSPPDDDDDDVYDPEMVDYLLEMPLEKKKKPQSSCIIPLTGGFQSPTTKAEVHKGVDAVVYGSSKPLSIPPVSPPSVQSKSGLKTTNRNKPGGTPLRDECSTPPSQEDSPMLKAATSNPIEFLTKIITSSRQSPGNNAPSSSFLSSLSLLTQTVQSAAQKEKSEQHSADTEGEESSSHEPQNPPKTLKIDANQQAPKQNNARPSGQTPVPFSIGALVSSFKESSTTDAMSGANVRQMKKTVAPFQTSSTTGVSKEPHDTPARSTASNVKQNHTNAGGWTPMPFSIGALVSSFHEESKPPSATAVSTPLPVSKSAPFGPAVYQKPSKVPLCQIMNMTAPSTLAVPLATVSSAVTAKPSETISDASAGASTLADETDSLTNSLMARLMQHKTKGPPVFTPPVTSNITPGFPAQPPNFQSLILEPPPPPPLPPEEPMDSITSIPLPLPEDPMPPLPPHLLGGPPQLLSGLPFPPGGPPLLQSGPPPLPPSGPPPLPPSGPPLPSSCPPLPPSGLPPLPPSSPPPSGPPPPAPSNRQPSTPSGTPNFSRPPPQSTPPPSVALPVPPRGPPFSLSDPPPHPSDPSLHPIGPAPHTTGPAPHTTGPPPHPSGPLSHPSGSLSHPSGSLSHPSGPLSHPSGPPPCPSGPLSRPSGLFSCPTGPPPHLSGPPPRPSGPLPHLSGPHPHPSRFPLRLSGPLPHPSGPPLRPSGPPSHHSDPPPRPTDLSPHPIDPSSHPINLSPHPIDFSQHHSNIPQQLSSPPLRSPNPGPPRFPGEFSHNVTGPETPGSALSATTRNAVPRMQIRAPPPPPGPPPPNAKRGGSTLTQAIAGPPTSIPNKVQSSDTPPTSPRELASDALAHTEHQPSSPASTKGPVNPEQNQPAEPPQPTSPIPVVGTIQTRSIPVLGQSKSAKDMWEKPPVPSRLAGVVSRYNEFPTQPSETIDYSHSRPIETVERKRMPQQERFREDKPPSEVFRTTEQRHDLKRDRYPSFPHSNSSRDEGYSIGRGRGYTNQLYRQDSDPDWGHGHRYDRHPAMEFRSHHVPETELDYERDRNMGRRQDFNRPGAQQPASSYEQSHFRSTKQLIENELSALAGDLQPKGRGAPISTLEGRSERGRHASDYASHRRGEPHFWRGATKRAGQPTWGQPPPHYRY